jgi:hypothetical protein
MSSSATASNLVSKSSQECSRYAKYILGTSVVSWYECAYNSKTKVIFVDTPGFDDTYKSDVDILREIADRLSQAYGDNIKLTGIIYLHRIADVRLGGAAMKNLSVFKELCGDDAFSSVVLATTWWDAVDLAIGKQREKELTTTELFWMRMLKRGSKLFRQDNGVQSARKIVDYLVDRKLLVTLKIQEELVTEKKTLDQTGAGLEIGAQLNAQSKAFEDNLKRIREDLADAIRERDRVFQEELVGFKEAVEEKMKKAEEDRLRLQMDREELHHQREAELAGEKMILLKEIQENDERIKKEEYELKLMEEKRENESLKLQLETELRKRREMRLKLERQFNRKQSDCVVM